MSTPNHLPDTHPLTGSEDLSREMVAGLHDYFDRLVMQASQRRADFWQRDFSSPEDYSRSVQPNRERLARMVGLVDQRQPVEMRQGCAPGQVGPTAETALYTIQDVRWHVFEGIEGEGLLLTPRGAVYARVIALPDADQSPEQLAGLAPGIDPDSQFARRLAENGIQVLVPTLVNRDCRFSASPVLGQTNQSHREWIYRQAFEMGRHIIGLELQKVLAVVDWFQGQAPSVPLGVCGYGEGGLLAFFAGALDARLQATWVSGYFKPREELWREPIDRNLWGLLVEFGDAEIASLIAPRSLVVEYSREPAVDYSPPMDEYGPQGVVAAPGKLSTPPFERVQGEFTRIDTLVGPVPQVRRLFRGPGGDPLSFGSQPPLEFFAGELGVLPPFGRPEPLLLDPSTIFDPLPRQERQVRQMERFLQALVRESEFTRARFFLRQVRLDAPASYIKDARALRRQLWEEVIGQLEDPQPEMNPRSRLVYEQEKWTGYEVVLDVWPEVFAWGILCIPRDLQAGEKRPVVVCQHGYESLPRDTIEDTEDGLRYYRRFAARLAEQGFITFAPHNPYRGFYRYKQLQRKANPLKASLGSVLVAQHTQVLHWLSGLSCVDPERIAFYGLSYGGWTAVRIPPIVEQYCLSICSAAFNDWIRKVTSPQFNNSYMGDASFEMCEWNAGNTFSNAEMACLMAPRPFMVERGMHDIVAPDAWVAAEYARVRWLYTQLGISERTAIEFFNGEHCINGQGTFDFLHHHLHWPPPNKRGNP